MWSCLLLILTIYGISCEPETVRDNFDYFSYGNEESILKNLDLHAVRYQLSQFDNKFCMNK